MTTVSEEIKKINPKYRTGSNNIVANLINKNVGLRLNRYLPNLKTIYLNNNQ